MGELKNRLLSVLGDLTGPQLRAFWAAKHPLVWLLAVAIGVVNRLRHSRLPQG
jgi:hypothetical protein